MTTSVGEHHFSPSERLVWVDLEMTGLSPEVNTIVEVAAIITEPDLTPVGEGIDIVVHASEDELATMGDFVREMHTKSGLIDEIRASQVTLREAEEAVVALVREHCGSPTGHKPLLAGNSIATDRSFIRRHMPELHESLHYRMIDVSTIKELARRWYSPVYYSQPPKGMNHRALADITESIEELKFYRRTIFVPECPSIDDLHGNNPA